MSTMNSNTRIAATRCSLGTWFVSGIQVYIPDIKEIPRIIIIIIIIIIIKHVRRPREIESSTVLAKAVFHN